MAVTVRKYNRVPGTVDAAEYDGTRAGAEKVLGWIQRRGGLGFSAAELGWRHEVGAYWHKDHGFVYLPAGARTPGSRLEMLRDDELVIHTGTGFALVFPGDFVVRSRRGFYPLRAESFHRNYRSNSVAGKQASRAAKSPPPS